MRNLMIAVAGVCFIAGCGSGSSSSGTDSNPGTSANATSSATIDYDKTVAPILAASCAGAACHGQGSGNVAFVGNQALFMANRDEAYQRLGSTDPAMQMPVPGGPETLSDANRATLIAYLQQAGAAAATTGTTAATPDNTGAATAGTPFSGSSTKLCVSLTADEKTAGAAVTPTQIETVLAGTCAGGGCHSNGAAQTPFVDNDADLMNQTVVAGMLVDLQNGSMPKGKTISDADKTAIESYICGHFDL